jgi:uncharacterized DUF497 family protein
VDISFDPAKNARNTDVHGVSFERAIDFDWSRAAVMEDTRRDYGEVRFRALGPIDGRIHMLVFTWRNDYLHVISLRKANQREVRVHVEQTQIDSSD